MGGFARSDTIVLKNPQRQEMEDAIYRGCIPGVAQTVLTIALALEYIK
jgi:hypothetical protein